MTFPIWLNNFYLFFHQNRIMLLLIFRFRISQIQYPDSIHDKFVFVSSRIQIDPANPLAILPDHRMGDLAPIIEISGELY